MLTLLNARLLTGELVDITLRAGIIGSICPAGTTPPVKPTTTGTSPKGTATTTAPETINCEGRTAIPGLWDHHVHFTQWAAWSRQPSVASARSSAEVAAVARTRKPLDPGAPIILTGSRPALFPQLPHKQDLADIAFPVVVVSVDHHSVWLNQLALDRYGRSDHPTGFLLEEEAFAVLIGLHDYPTNVVDSWAGQATQAAAARGIVGIIDLEFDFNLPHWLRREANGIHNMRVDAGFYPQHLDEALETGLATGDHASDLVRMGPLKIISDGSLGSLTARVSHPYPGGGCGVSNVSLEQMKSLVERAARGKLATTIHAIGDVANQLALDAFEITGVHRLGIPGTIEHVQCIAPADVQRLKALNVTASVQPEHAMDDRELIARHWPTLLDRTFLLRSLLTAGAKLSFGSDAPVSPLDPWFAIASATTRTREIADGPWHPGEAITLKQALTASTRSTLAAGQVADVVIVDGEINEPSALRTMPIAATILGGDFSYRSTI